MAAHEGSKLKAALERLTPKQRQYLALAAIIACGVGALWAVFAFTDTPSLYDDLTLLFLQRCVPTR